MFRLRFFRTCFVKPPVQILSLIFCRQSGFTCRRQHTVECPENLDNSCTKPRAHLRPKHQINGHISTIKIPRFLRKTKDKKQIDRYYCVKKLCMEGNFELAISNVEKWLSSESTTRSTILILNGLLYSLLEHQKMEDIVKLKRTIDKYDIKGDRSTYTVLIDSFGKMKNFQMVCKLLNEMSHLNIDHHYRSYMVATQLALDEKSFAKAHEYFSEIESVYKENHDDFCATFILTLILNKEVGIMGRIFQEFRENKTRFGEKTMLAIEKYFHSGLSKEKWKTRRTAVSTSGICQCCQEELEDIKFGKPEEDLSVYFHELINHELNTSSGKMSDRKIPKRNKLQELLLLLKTEGPFQIVIDGLNVAMHPRRGLDFDPLFRLVENYSSQGQRVLIIAANELIHPKRSKAVSIVEHQKAMAYLRGISTVYFVKHNESGIDDLFLVSAALHLCRHDENVKMISNDKFMDHCLKMKPQILRSFKRWLSHHQIRVHWHETKKMFAGVVQKSKTSWHFPSNDGKTWLCVKRI